MSMKQLSLWPSLVLQIVLSTHCWGFPGGTVVKNPPANAGGARNVGLIPGLGRSSAEENGNPLQCSCLENSVVRGAW